MNNLKTIEIGAKFINEVNNPNGGLTVDMWHTSRGGTRYVDLAAILPMDKVFIVEIDDARKDVVGSLWEDTINERLYPGEGDLDAVVSHPAPVPRLAYTRTGGVGSSPSVGAGQAEGFGDSSRSRCC